MYLETSYLADVSTLDVRAFLMFGVAQSKYFMTNGAFKETSGYSSMSSNGLLKLKSILLTGRFWRS